LSPDSHLWRFFILLETKLGNLEAFSKPSESLDEAGPIPLGAVGSFAQFLIPFAANVLLWPPFRALAYMLARYLASATPIVAHPPVGVGRG